MSARSVPSSAPSRKRGRRMDKERDAVLLRAIDSMIKDAPDVGICPIAFEALKEEVLRIMDERDTALKMKEAEG